MSKVHFSEALEDNLLEIADKFLVIETRHDGYTNTHLGKYAFRVIQEGEEYKVFPVYLRDDGTYVNEKYPVIQTDEDLVLFSMNTTIDPYGEAHVDELELHENMSKEHGVLHAFDAYVKDAFRLAVYHIMIANEDNYIEETEIPFEKINKFERDVIHPRAGQRK